VAVQKQAMDGKNAGVEVEEAFSLVSLKCAVAAAYQDCIALVHHLMRVVWIDLACVRQSSRSLHCAFVWL
jgi:hypothetical protein